MCNLKGNPSTTQNTTSNTNQTQTQVQDASGLQGQLSATGPTPETLALYMQLLNQAQGIGQTPFDTNTMGQTAPWTDVMNQAVNAQFGLGQQGMGFVPQAAGAIGAGAQSTIGQIPGVASSLMSPWAGQGVDFGLAQGQKIGDWGTGQGTAISDYAQNLAAQGPQLQQFSQGAVDQYLSPYISDVVNATQNQFTNANAQQGNALLGQGIKAGNAFGGDRAGIAAAQLGNQQQLAQAPVIAGLYNQGYAQALQEYNQQNQLAAQLGQIALGGMEQGGQLGLQGLTAQGALGMQGLGLGLNASTAANQQAIGALGQNQQAELQGGQLFGNLGATQFGQNLQGGQQSIAAAAAYPSWLQNLMNTQQQNALMAQSYPFQTTSWYGGLLGGLGPLTGNQGATLSAYQNAMNNYIASQGTTVGTGVTTPPQASTLGQIAGLGIAGLGLLSDERAKEDMEQVGKTSDGQPIYRFRYKGDPTTQLGLSAQEAEQKNPDAVSEVGGLKFVDYRRATDDAVRRAAGGAVNANSWTQAPYKSIILPGGTQVQVKSPVPNPSMPRSSLMTLPQPASAPNMPQAAGLPRLSSMNAPSPVAATQNPITKALGDFASSPSAVQGAKSLFGFQRGGMVQRYADGGWDEEDTEDNSMSPEPWPESQEQAPSLAPPDQSQDTDFSSQQRAPAPTIGDAIGEASMGFAPGRRYMEQLPGTGQRPGNWAQDWATNPLTQIGLAMAGSNSPTFMGALTTGLGAGAHSLSRQKAEQDRLDQNYKIDNSGMEQTIRFADGRVFHTGLPTPRGLQLTQRKQGRIPAGYREKTPGGDLEPMPGGPGTAKVPLQEEEVAPPTETEAATPPAPVTQTVVAQAVEQNPPKTEEDVASTTLAGLAAQRTSITTPYTPKQLALIESWGWTPETADFNAMRLAGGDQSVVQGFGGGKQGAAMRGLLKDRAARYYLDIGMTPKEANAALAEFGGLKRGASTLGQLDARMTAALEKAAQVAPVVTGLSEQIDRTQFPLLNNIIMAAQKGTGDPKIVQYGIAVETLASNYGTALGMGNSVLTDFQTRRAQDLLQLGYSKGQMKAAVDQIMVEIDREQRGVGRAMKVYMGQVPGSAAGAAKDATTPLAPEGEKAGPVAGEAGVMRKQFKSKDGKPVWGVSRDGGKTWGPE